jgi:hypothetical protein
MSSVKRGKRTVTRRNKIKEEYVSADILEELIQILDHEYFCLGSTSDEHNQARRQIALTKQWTGSVSNFRY